MSRFIVFFSLLCAAASAGAARNVLVFGDSLSAGYGLRPGEAWPVLLADRVREKAPEYAVANASISGETTAGGRTRLPAALRQHILVSDAAVLAKYQAKGCEIIRFSAADIAAARPKAMAAWRTATKGDALATKILDSQVAFMKELGLLA